MKVDLRLPSITSGTPDSQMSQIKSYLYQLVEQLNYSLNQIENGGDSAVAESPSASKSYFPSGQSGDIINTFNAMKTLIIKSTDIINAYYEEISKRLKGSLNTTDEFMIYSDRNADNFEMIMQRITENGEDIALLEISDGDIERKIDFDFSMTSDGKFKVGRTFYNGTSFDIKEFASFGESESNVKSCGENVVSLSGKGIDVTNLMIGGFRTINNNGITIKWE